MRSCVGSLGRGAEHACHFTRLDSGRTEDLEGASQRASAALVSTGRSIVERCPHSSTISSLDPEIPAAISSWRASGISASCLPHMMSVGQAMRDNSGRLSVRLMIARSSRMKASLPVFLAILLIVDANSRFLSCDGWISNGSRTPVIQRKRPRSASEMKSLRLRVCSGVSARAVVSSSASFRTRGAA